MTNKRVGRNNDNGKLKQIIRVYSHLIRQSSNSIKHRLKVLKLAEETGNVSAACCQSGMDRTSFYKYKKRFEKYGVNGLKDLPPSHHNHSHTTELRVVKRIASLSARKVNWFLPVFQKDR